MDKINIRAAAGCDLERVMDFYHSLIDAMKDAEYKPGWKKGIYPTRESIADYIAAGELYIGESDGQIVSSMAVNHEFNEGYRSAGWSVDAGSSELLVIHILGVRYDLFGSGIAAQMVRFVIDKARRDCMKAIRLDVIEGNLPAEKAYTKFGFSYRETVKMFYDDTGWMDFKLFEYVI